MPKKVPSQNCIQESLIILHINAVGTRVELSFSVQIPDQKCREYPVKLPKKIPKEECHTHPREECKKIPKQVPRQVAEKVPRYYCDDHHESLEHLPERVGR